MTHIFTTGFAAVDARYHHFPPTIRRHAQEFEREWNICKATVPPENSLRRYVEGVLDQESRIRNSKGSDTIPVFLPDERPIFWSASILALMRRENPISKCFLAVFCNQLVGPLEGEFSPRDLLETSGILLYPRANFLLLDDNPIAQDRYDRVVSPQRFVLDFVRHHPRPHSVTEDAIEAIMENHVSIFPGDPDIYRISHVDLMYLLAEEIKRYRPTMVMRAVFASLGALCGGAITLADALDKVLQPYSVTTSTQIGNGTEPSTASLDPISSSTVGTIQIASLAAGCAFGLSASFVVEGRLCGYRIPQNMSDEMIENHAGMIALYLTFLHKDHLYRLSDREARRNFWRRYVPRWGRLIADSFYQHNPESMSWSLVHIFEDAWVV